jgi:hypothetical protein
MRRLRFALWPAGLAFGLAAEWIGRPPLVAFDAAADTRLRTRAMRDNFRLRTVSYLNAQKPRACTSAQQT